MFLKIKITLFTVFCGLLLMSVSVSAQEKANKKTAEKTTTVTALPAPTPTVKDSKIELPEAEGWEKGDVQTYPAAELGYSVAYQSREGGTVTIYVYNGGNQKIADGIADKVVKNEMDRAKSDIVEIGKMGRYQNVKEIKSETVTLGGSGGKVKSLHALFSFEIGGRAVDSEIYLFGYKNNFIKIRATRPVELGEGAKGAMNSLLTEIDNTFSK